MTKMEANGVLRNGEVKKTPTPLVIDKDALSLSSSEDEEGQRTPLPGSTCHLDIDDRLPDEEPEYELRVTVISSGQDDVGRKSRYSTNQQAPPPRLISRPDNHVCMAIAGMICCFFPLGIVGLACALQVDATYDDGNRENAVWRSTQAKYWSLTAIVCGMLGVLGGGFYLIFFHLVPAVT